MNAVVGLAQMQRANHPHALGPGAECHAQDAECQIDNTKNKGEDLCSRESTGKAEIECDHAGNNVDDVVHRRQVCAEQVWLCKADYTHQQENDSQNLANSLCHL